jgi:Cytochrome P460
MTRVSSAHRRAALAVAAGIALALSACSGGEGDGAGVAGTSAPPASVPATAPAAPPAPPALPGLPEDITGFQSWDTLNAEPIPPDSAQTRRVGFDAHRGTKEVYVRRSGAEAPFPDGTIVVKAARDADFVHLVAIMRKIRGSDPEHGDWQFVEYQRSSAGEAFTTGAGLTGATCWSCHSIARETDWVFTPRGR